MSHGILTRSKVVKDVFEDRAIAAQAELLADVSRSPSRRRAERLFKAFMIRASASEGAFEASFLAAQMVRDIGVITRTEGTFVFQELVTCRQGAFCPAAAVVADFYRACGEGATAAGLEDDPAQFKRRVEKGRLSLIDGKSPERSAMVRSHQGVAKITEAVAAMAECETKEGTARQWRLLKASLRSVSALVAVRAVRSLRDTKLLSRGESIRLIELVIVELVDRLSERERKRRSWQKIRERFGPDDMRRVKAACLERLGEHDLANLLLSDPDGYHGFRRYHRPPSGLRPPVALAIEMEAALLRMRAQN